MADQSTGFAGLAKFACAILVIVLFMWTPLTGKHFLIYGALLVVVVLLVIFTSRSRKDAANVSDSPGNG
jgi:hypothetical protein